MDLNAIMDFDRPIQVHADGTVTDAPANIYAPDVYDDNVSELGEWTLMDGYSGQDHYSGPIMHPSEYIGGRMELDILAWPGIYVAVVVNVLPDHEDDDPEPAGWAIARMD